MSKVNKSLTPRTTVHETFSRFVQAGAVVVITFGPLAEKAAVISDIIDQNRVIIDGPTSDVPRQVINVKWLSLTDLRLTTIGRGASTKAIKAALAKDDVVGKWKSSPWGKSIEERQVRANLNDFERFQARHALKLINHATRTQFKTLQRASRGLGPKVAKKKAAKGKPAAK